MKAEILIGDVTARLAEMPADSVQAIVTDPPYGLNFMGRGWDHGVPPESVWTEALRVAQPGAHLLAFGGTRTFHRLTCAIEDAGWEIRDCLMWLYGSGFPKSLDVSKAIDKAARRDYVLAAVRLGLAIPDNSLHDWTKAEHSPSDRWWDKLKAVLSPEDWLRVEREVVSRNARPAGWFTAQDGHDVTAPATDAARQWSGWGTALKPAWEPIILARKPLAGTVAANVQAHGTGALNVDGCRIGTDGGGNVCPGGALCQCETSGISFGKTKHAVRREGAFGRWPANLALDQDAARMLDEQSGENRDSAIAPYTERAVSPSSFNFAGRQKPAFDYGGSGGASRFFYTSKASSTDRDRDLGNKHPTVKPVDLMRWLVRLVTPPGGTVLDPFCGSGSTGVAALGEGFDFIGIDADPESCEVARRRLESVAPLLSETTVAPIAAEPDAQAGMFEGLTGVETSEL